MKLKRLILQGYKTFASKTEFVFDDGITTVVGPNGSGKSNIADAIRWVLGEQRYGELRGKRTEDMIFAGSQSRPRAGMAQATLTLDNSDGWLPIDYSEVEIGRRAYRSGDNEYYINGQKVRLKDVSALLATSGLAERTYTMIGQGLIDKALSLRADERRALFEEAAGINHYKSRRAETLRRLQDTQRNLQRVHDILAEIRPRLTSLKRQATRARNYEQIAVDLRQLLRLWYGHRWEQAKQELRLARETAETAETAWNNARRQLLVHQENVEDIRRRITQLQQRSNDIRTKRDELRDQLIKIRRDVAILQERQTALKQQLVEVEQEVPLQEGQRQTAQADLNAATTELVEAQNNLQNNQSQLQEFTASFASQQKAINQWQQTLRQREQEREASQKRLAQSEGQVEQLRERLAEQEADTNTDEEAQLSQLDATISQLTATLTQTREQSETLRQQRLENNRQRQALIRDLKQLRRDAKETDRQLNKQRNQTARMETRVDMLDQMRRKITPTDDVAIVGQFASLITIPNEYQTAVASALANQLATLILNNSDDLWQLNHKTTDPLTLLVLSNQPPLPTITDTPKDTAVIGWASDLVTSPPQHTPIVQRLLGHLLLVKDAQTAYHLAPQLPTGSVVAALDGFVAHANGLIALNGRSDNILAQEAAWRQAERDLTAQKAIVAAAETAVTQQQATIQTKQEQVDALQSDDHTLTHTEQKVRQQQTKAERELDRAQQQQSYLQRQQASRSQNIAKLRDRITQVEKTIAIDQQKLVQLNEDIVEARMALDDLPITEANQQRQTLQQNISAAQTIVAGRQAVVDSRRATLNQINNQLARLQTRQNNIQQQLAKLTLGNEETAEKQLQTRLDRLQAELHPITENLAEARQAMHKLERDLGPLQRQAHELETRYTQAKIKFTQRENQIENLQERIKADLGIVALPYDDEQTGATPLPMGEVVEQLPEVAELPDDIENTIQTYRGQLHRMGAINPDAPAEYNELSQRHDFLEQQIDDLNQTETQLRQVIAELDELTSNAFAATVAEVNTHFSQTFTQLFGGGTAQLILTDPDDLTISGVDILARLPNRREQGLGLLSGGERSLTATALIFSLLKVSPTPFCVMDEVDAALDEANITRFRDLLRELSLRTQFVVITHNRGTVQAAQTIYGISMGTDSASKVISIKPEDYIRQAELL